MSGNLEQHNNKVGGDIVGRDKVIINQTNEPKANKPIRQDQMFDLEVDGDNSTLLRKLTVGKMNGQMKMRAITSKLNALKIIFELNKSEQGKQVLSDVYENLLTAISKVVMPLDDGDLLKYKSEDIFNQFPRIISRFENIMDIDEAFLEGLLYLATSNCAIRWKVDDAS
ncbi:hypothetical protein P9H28_00770 [Paenibacillus barengoltzii]|uniref:hypothetical protein n=1 Tax=Paenibacillus barengoltzii TaxID=343517 RepID=UPI002DB85860|nr:hypothetical protein [Paenibacillus barengoltzii]MEC2342634.1 hypothetical protein [Paenibacillus barengoltzii]